MSELPARNRVIYQSEALFISPDTTGHHIYYSPNWTGNQARCMITGKNAKDEEIKFDVCSGTGSDGTNFSGATFSCYNAYDKSGSFLTGVDLKMSGVHPVLVLAGFSGSENIKGQAETIEHLSGKGRKDFDNGSWKSAISQLKRVQSANYSFTINRQDINQFGHLGRLDAVVLEAPTVSMDFSYYLTDGFNERMLGFSTDGKQQNLSGIMTRSQNEFGNSFFILTVPEGRDAVVGDQLAKEKNKSVISLGNGYITDYSIEASVGSFPTVSVSVEGVNIKSDIGTEWKSIPAIDPSDGTLDCDTCFSLPPAEKGSGESVLKPGDITIDLADAALISKQISGDQPGYGSEDKGSAHIQSFTLSTPLGRSDLQRLGNSYAYAKEIDFPVTCTLTVNALVADLKAGNLVNMLCGNEYDLSVSMKPPKCVECGSNDEQDAIRIDFKNALLDSESFSSSIGDNKTVDLTFSTQIGGPEEQGVGVFFSGSENTGSKLPPKIANTGDFSKYFESSGAAVKD